MSSPARALNLPGSGERSAALDGVRGIAILLILAVHFTILPVSAFGGLAEDVPFLDLAFLKVMSAGWVGVDLFFVLSGFLITGILYNSRSAARHYFRNFYMRRALRIFPVYYGFLLLLLFALPLIPAAQSGAAGSLRPYLGWYAMYLHNIRFAIDAEPVQAFNYLVGHLWSLAVEEQFYLVWPIIVLLFRRRVLMSVCVVFAISALLIRIGLQVMDVSPVTIYTLTPARMDALAVGAFVALAARDPSDLRHLIRWARPVAAVSLLILVVLSLQRGELYLYDPPVQAVGFTALALLFGTAVLAAVTAQPGTVVHGLLTRRALTELGKYSYALYLFHWPVGNLVIRETDLATTMPLLFGSALPRILLFGLVASAISLGAAVMSWHLWEKQFLRLKSLFPYSTSEPAPSSSAAPHRETARRASEMPLAPPALSSPTLRARGAGHGAGTTEAEGAEVDEDAEPRAA